MMLWWAVALVAVLVALDKSLIPGTAILGMGVLANLMPAREASGITLALIIVGDWAAIWAYRGNVDWKALRQLLPNVLIGVLAGVLFLSVADDELTKHMIGIILLLFLTWNVTLMVVRRRHEAAHGGARSGDRTDAEGESGEAGSYDRITEPGSTGDFDETSASDGSAGHGHQTERTGRIRPRWLPRPKSIGFGSLAGFTTMVANAGGPVTAMFFFSEGFSIKDFLGTSAWFYLTVNLIKLPFSLGLGMLTPGHLPMVAAMVPVIVVTVLIGHRLSARLNPQVFTWVIIILTYVAAIELVIE